jgi:hypothetical protein
MTTPSMQLPSGTVTFLFIDIEVEGSTRLAREYQAGYSFAENNGLIIEQSLTFATEETMIRLPSRTIKFLFTDQESFC